MLNTATETAKMIVEIGVGRRGNPIIMQNCITAKLHNRKTASVLQK